MERYETHPRRIQIEKTEGALILALDRCLAGKSQQKTKRGDRCGISEIASHLLGMQIFTIGYQGVTQNQLITALSGGGVELVADIRAVPLSRRPGFSKNVLAAGLREVGIGYVGLNALGTPPEGREAARKGDYQKLAEVYLGQLGMPEAMQQAAELIDMAAEQATAVLCFERNPEECHRSILLKAIMPSAEAVHLYP